MSIQTYSPLKLLTTIQNTVKWPEKAFGGGAARPSFPLVMVYAPSICVAARIVFLRVELEGITNRRRVGHDEGQKAGYNGKDGESHGFKYVLLF